MTLVAVLSDAGLRRSEASSLTWGDVQRWDDDSGRIAVARSKTDVEAQGVNGGGKVGHVGGLISTAPAPVVRFAAALDTRVPERGQVPVPRGRYRNGGILAKTLQ